MAEMMTIKEVAEMLKFTERTIYRRIKDGSIPSVKIGGSVRIPKKELQEYIERQRVS